MGLFKVVVNAGQADKIVKQFEKKDIAVLSISNVYTPSIYSSKGSGLFREIAVFVVGPKGYQHLDELSASRTIHQIVSAEDMRRWEKEDRLFYWMLGIMLGIPVLGALISLMMCGS